GEVELADGAQPFLRDMRLDGVAHQLEALEDVAEHLVEAVQVALVLHQRGAGEVVEVLHAAVGEVGLEGFHQRQILLQRHRQSGGSELMEEVDEHREPALSRVAGMDALSRNRMRAPDQSWRAGLRFSRDLRGSTRPSPGTKAPCLIALTT